MTGMAVGLNQLPGLKFRANKPHAFCCICGDVYQHPDDRLLEWSPIHQWRHDDWRTRHTKARHTEHEVNSFRLSGLSLTPEAAHRLAPYGVISLDGLFDAGLASAMAEAPRAPVDDAEY